MIMCNVYGMIFLGTFEATKPRLLYNVIPISNYLKWIDRVKIYLNNNIASNINYK